MQKLNVFLYTTNNQKRNIMKTISFIISTKTIKHLGINLTRKKKKIIKRYQRT